ncbi:fructosamine kinase family protein [Streptomyces sp. WMMC500]|uniref:fructosamine kinase family protein n=1 Tax=Streptomyces sp. WMMC500 TaxID=3015154 RepID=UPI00248C24C7|nr:fructosamine kinase family protein [Streptomyces sp. WMMC500]WBB57962.1 fructosamine kinase family protein [Streptomyces sp. WMMC500]
MSTPDTGALRGVEARAAALAGAPVRAARRVGGGDISAAHRLELADGRRVFAKTRAGAPADFFAAEAHGLRLLAGTGTVPVPAVLGEEPGMILLEWIEPGPATPAQAERLGRDLAALHTTPAAAYGTPWPAYIGSLPLPSPGASATPGAPGAPESPEPAPEPPPQHAAHAPASPADWPGFYAGHRLLPFLRLATDNGALTPADTRAVEHLCDVIDEVAGPPQPPAVIHGDLWSGNVQWSAHDRAHLVDPAAQGGHPEVDLAFLELFGCPQLGRLLGAYEEVRPLPGRRGRVPLYQLHHLLVHAALFGAGYGAQCGAAARAALAGAGR